MLLSSRAASTSSRMQKGLGLAWNMARRSATAVMDFSPPERRLIERSSFPGGWATISIPASKISGPSSRKILDFPPPKSLRNMALKLSLISLKLFSKSSLLVWLIFLMISAREFLAFRRSSLWVVRKFSRISNWLSSSRASRLTLPSLSTLVLSSSISWVARDQSISWGGSSLSST